MPLYSDLSSLSHYYSGGSTSYNYMSGPYASHSSIVASNFARPSASSNYGKTASRNIVSRGYKPHLATISETQSIGLARISSPKLALHNRNSPKFKYQRPISINTADIDVSTNRYHSRIDSSTLSSSPKKEYKAPERSSYKESHNDDPDDIFMPKMDSKRSTIKRERTVVRFHTVRNQNKQDSDDDIEEEEEYENGKKKVQTIKVFDEEIKVHKQKWRENFEPNELKFEAKKVEQKPLSEKLREKFMIKEKEEDEIAKMDEERKRRREENLMMFAEGPKLQRRASKRQSIKKPTFHEICRSVSSENVDEGLDTATPMVRKYSRKNSGIEDLRNIRRNSAEINREEVDALEQLLKDAHLDTKIEKKEEDNINDDADIKRRKKLLKKKSNEKLVLELESEQNSSQDMTKIEDGDLKRRKKFIKKKSNEKLVEEEIKKDSKLPIQRRKLVRKRSSTDLSKSIEAITPLILKEQTVAKKEIDKIIEDKLPLKFTTSVEVESKPNLKIVVDDIKVEKTKVSSPTLKIKYDVIIDEVISAENAKNALKTDKEKNILGTKELVEDLKIKDTKLEEKKLTTNIKLKDNTTLDIKNKIDAPIIKKDDDKCKDKIEIKVDVKPVLTKDVLKNEALDINKKDKLISEVDKKEIKPEIKTIEQKIVSKIPIETKDKKLDLLKSDKLPELKLLETKEKVQNKIPPDDKIEDTKQINTNKILTPMVHKLNYTESKEAPKVQMKAIPKIEKKLDSFDKQRTALTSKKQGLAKQISIDESNDDDFWGKIGKRETINFKNRKKYIDARKDMQLKEISWTEEDGEENEVATSVQPKEVPIKIEITTKMIDNTLKTAKDIPKAIDITKLGTASKLIEKKDDTIKLSPQEDKSKLITLQKQNNAEKIEAVTTKIPEFLQKKNLSVEEKLPWVTEKLEVSNIPPPPKMKIEIKKQINDEKKSQNVTFIHSIKKAELSIDIKPEVSLVKKIEKKQIIVEKIIPKVTSKVQMKQSEEIEYTKIPLIKKQLSNEEKNIKISSLQIDTKGRCSPLKNKLEKKQSSEEKVPSPTEKKKISLETVKVATDAVKIVPTEKPSLEVIKVNTEKAIPKFGVKLEKKKSEDKETPQTSQVKKIEKKLSEERVESVKKVQLSSTKLEVSEKKSEDKQQPQTSQIKKIEKKLSEEKVESVKKDNKSEVVVEKKPDRRSAFEKKFVIIPSQFSNQNSIDLDTTDLYEPRPERKQLKDGKKVKIDNKSKQKMKPKLKREKIEFKTLEVKELKAVITNIKQEPLKAELDFIIKEKYDDVLKPNTDIIVPSAESYKRQQLAKLKAEGKELKEGDVGFIPLQSNQILDTPAKAKPKPVWFDECPVVIMATPRDLRKRAIHRPAPPPSPSDSDDDSDDDTSDDDSTSDSSDDSAESDSNLVSDRNNNADKKRKSTSSNDSGFDSSAPGSPANNRNGVKGSCTSTTSSSSESRDLINTPAPAHNPAFALETGDPLLECSQAYTAFRTSGRVTPPATSIPRFRKYTVEDFCFLKVLGKGSFGKVLLAELKNTEYYYAVKCLKKDIVLEDDDVECTLIERKVLALGTKHPYLCHLFCTFQTESHLFFVMEYLNGGDLMFHIQTSGRFPEPRARFYGAEIVSGLKFLHSKGIVYRDLKLDNILLDFDGHVRIADFGMCKLQIFLDRTADTFCGTPDYMAPEIIKGQHYNQGVDWWSFGVLLYEMLIGQSPFSGGDEDELFWSICNERPVFPRFLSQEASLILTMLLEKDASKRLGNKYCPNGEIMDQSFFKQIDWDQLERRLLEPPFKPKVQHPLDTQYFDKAFTAERVKLTPIEKDILHSMDQTQFQGFSYTNPNATDK